MWVSVDTSLLWFVFIEALKAEYGSLVESFTTSINEDEASYFLQAIWDAVFRAWSILR